MLYPSIDKLLVKVGSKYLLVNVVSKRAKEMQETEHYQMKENEYLNFLENVFTSRDYNGLVIIHYPEALYKIAFQMKMFPERVVSWVYNSNTAKQHRDIAFLE